ncbi:hypothetical protein [Castellaniella defragrans]|uniref:hypothetical protein n=1 Tax=Castellaniella defragrans TaxID=75697 RepID=UPI0005BA90EE|nr:hypothetical protein [Castellaniella defragrans]
MNFSGTTKKADFDPSQGGFVSPLSIGVESHFTFSADGAIQGTTADGAHTIQILALDHASLVNDRAAAIKGWLSPKGKPLGAQQARRLIQALQVPDAQDCLQPYCEAIIQVLSKHATREERRAARLKHKGKS